MNIMPDQLLLNLAYLCDLNLGNESNDSSSQANSLIAYHKLVEVRDGSGKTDS